MKSIPKKAAMPANKKKQGRIWIHALSVGEVLSAEPLVKALAKKVTANELIFTASTQTGFETALHVVAPYVREVRHFPYDLLFSVNRALKVIVPCQVIIVETDIWPNFLYRLNRCKIPVYLVNARLSKRSYRGYKRVDFFMAPLLSIFKKICVQTDRDRQRFQKLGVDANWIVTVGNIKFDQEPLDVSSSDLKWISKQFRISPNSLVWVAGSTHEGEEEMLSGAVLHLRDAGIETTLIVAPRDPGRATDVCEIFMGNGIDARTMGDLESSQQSSNVVVIDRIGILRQVYALADVAFVGGSLVNAGGHNPLEPASVCKPILFGPYTEDFDWICRTLVESNGAFRVNDSDQLARQVHRLMSDRGLRNTMGRFAYDVFDSNRGAVERMLKVIEFNG